MNCSWLCVVVVLCVCVCVEGGPSTSLFFGKYRRAVEANLKKDLHLKGNTNVYYFQQKKDHFNALDKTMFSQRYFFNDTYLEKGGPVFFMLGQEGPSNPNDVSNGISIWLAPRYGAVVVELEHRYYGPGESVPVDDLSTPNMQWLSSEQALEDFAYFRTQFHALHPELGLKADTPWVIFGCSYAGAMSSWLRLKYPHLFLTAVGGSGPVNAKVDFFEYDEVVSYSLSLDSPNCHTQSQLAMQQVGELALDPANWPSLQTQFNTCTPIVDPVLFVDTVYNPIAFSVQYNEAHLNYPRVGLCQTMTNTSNTPIENLVLANQDPRFGNAPGCLVIDIYNGPDGLLNTSTSVEFRKWFWQTCSEFGYYQSAAAPPKNTLSTIVNVTFFLEMCSTTFDNVFTFDQIYSNADSTNLRYGSTHPDPTNVLYPNGFEDPWSSLGVKTILQPTDNPVLWRGSGHCAPYYTPQEDEPPSVKEGRQIIQTWLDYLLPHA